jgi:hypothetical protein
MDNQSQLEINQLSPFITVSLLRFTSNQNPEILQHHKNHLQQILKEKIIERSKKNLHIESISPFEPIKISSWSIFGIWYRVEQAPYWLKNVRDENDLYDVKHHMALILLNENFGVLAFSDQAFRKKIRDILTIEYRDHYGKFFESITKEELSKAFLGGQAKQTWMQGVHIPITTKPDSKIMTGIDLRDSIDPFSDQTYYLNAALSDIESGKITPNFRSNLPEGSSLREIEAEDAIGDAFHTKKNRLLGVSFKNNIIWTRISQDMNDFVNEVDKFIEMLSFQVDPTQAHQFGFEQVGYDMLQRPSKNIISLDQLGLPVEIYLDLPIPSEEEQITYSKEKLAAIYDWQENWEMNLIERADSAKGEIFANVLNDGKNLAKIRIQPRLLGDGEVDFRINALESDFKENRDLEQNFDIILCEMSEKLSLWYTEGYAIREKLIYDVNFRDVPFNNWKWLKMKGYKVDKEKPDKDEVGNSLFEFVVTETQQIFGESSKWYLICDDRPGEIADFIYIDVDKRCIGLIHVKAAGHAKRRGIAPAKYEVVISQASKNLRFLDIKNLRSSLEREGSGGRLRQTWGLNSNEFTEMNDRSEAIAALDNIGTFPEKFVVILQPHTSKSAWQEQLAKLRNDSEMPDSDKYQILRLKTMIVELEEACKRLGGELIVCGEDDEC